jgi:hypothetical protein
MYRDNTKPFTPRQTNGNSKTVRNGNPRPGTRNHNKPAGAGSVASVNGKTPRPGYKQNKPAGGGTGSVARPGGPQSLNRGVNAK